MHPLHPMNPYNNGHKTLGSACNCSKLHGLGQEVEPAWYENPLWILAGVGVLYYMLTRG